MIHRKGNNCQDQNNEGSLNGTEHIQGSAFICMDEETRFGDAVSES